MRKVTIQVESLDAGLERFKRAWKTGESQGEFITFESAEALLKTLTGRRWELVQALLCSGAMSLRALARELGRDVKNVHADVNALKEIGLVEDHEKGIWVPFDEVEAHLWAKRATASSRNTDCRAPFDMGPTDPTVRE